MNWVSLNGKFGKSKYQNFLGLIIIKKLAILFEGDVVVTPDGGQLVQMGKGNLVTFPAAMSCTWEIKNNVKKHYFFD
jgi:hypothetical protein